MNENIIPIISAGTISRAQPDLILPLEIVVSKAELKSNRTDNTTELTYRE